MSGYIAVLLFFASVSVWSLELWKRLIPGTDCSSRERLHHVHVLYESTGSKAGTCGGTLINKDWILTAGHCYKENRTGTLKVTVGVHPTTISNKTLTIPSTNIKKYSSTLSDGDIMLLKLPEAVNDITPAQLPDVSYTHPATTNVLQVAGHGSASNVYGKTETSLKCLNISLVPCQNLRGSAFEKDEQVFCGGNLPDQPVIDSCAGDSGGGLVLNAERDIVIGVLIGGRRGGCGGQIVFTDVFEYTEWIKNIISI